MTDTDRHQYHILERVKVISGFQKFEITKYMELQMCITL